MTWFERVNRMKSENVYKVCKYFYLNYDYLLALEYSDTGSWYSFSLGSSVEFNTDMFCSVRQRGVTDLDLQIREGGGHPDTEIRGGGPTGLKKFFFQPFGPQFGLNIRGRAPWPPPLDPPLERQGEA